MKNLLFLTITYCFITLTAQAQTTTNVSGLVQDTNGNPISYVNVGIVGGS